MEAGGLGLDVSGWDFDHVSGDGTHGVWDGYDPSLPESVDRFGRLADRAVVGDGDGAPAASRGSPRSGCGPDGPASELEPARGSGTAEEGQPIAWRRALAAVRPRCARPPRTWRLATWQRS